MIAYRRLACHCLFLFLCIFSACGSEPQPTPSAAPTPQQTEHTQLLPETPPTQAETPAAPQVTATSPPNTPDPLPLTISADNFTDITYLAHLGGPPAGALSRITWTPDGHYLLAEAEHSLLLYAADGPDLVWLRELPDAFQVLGDGAELAILNGSTLSIKEMIGAEMHRVELQDFASADFLISPDGSILAARTGPAQAAVWDTVSGEKVQEIDLGAHFEMDLETLAGLAFNADGSQLLASTIAGGVYQADLESGAVVRLFQAAFVPDPTIVSNTPSECFTLPANGAALAVLCARYTGTADGSAIASSSYSLRWTDGGEPRSFAFDTFDSYSHFSISPDGRTIYMQGVGKYALLRLQPGEITLEGAPGCLNHTPDPFFTGPSGTGLLAVINSYEPGELFLCDLGTGETVVAREFEPVSSLAIGIAGDRYRVAVGRCDGTIELWTPPALEPDLVIQAHTGCVNDLAFNLYWTHLASAGEDGLANIWILDPFSEQPVFTYDHGRPVRGVALGADAGHLGSISLDQVQVVDVADGKVLYSDDLDDGLALAFGPNQTLLYTDGGTIYWRSIDGLDNRFILSAGDLLFNPRGMFTARITTRRDAAEFYAVEPLEYFTTLEPGERSLLALSQTLDGCTLITIPEYGPVRFWDTTPLTEIGSFDPLSSRDIPLVDASISPDGRILAFGYADGAVRLWGIPGALATLPGDTVASFICRQLSTPDATPTPAPTNTNTPEPTGTPVPFTRNLMITEPNMQGSDVLALQERLLELGYTGIGIPDGVFGEMTDQTVRQFQEDNNLVVDGIVGPVTWELLFGNSG